MKRRLSRNMRDKMLGGVASGIAEHLNIDTSLVRLLFICAVIFGGSGILIYIILWIVLPENHEPYTFTASEANPDGTMPPPPNNNFYTPEWNAGKGSLVAGVILIGIGVLFLLHNLLDINVIRDFWPVILIIIGVAMLLNTSKNER